MARKFPKPDSDEEDSKAAPPFVYNENMDVDKTVEQLQKYWLQRMLWLMENGLISSAELATLEKFLSRNGWTVDPTKLPSKLRDKLVKNAKLDDDGDDIAGYIGERMA